MNHGTKRDASWSISQTVPLAKNTDQMAGNSSHASFSSDEEDLRACKVNPPMEVIEISSDSDSDIVFCDTRGIINTDNSGFRNIIELIDSDTSLELPDLLSPMVTRPCPPKSPRKTSPTARKYLPLYADTSDDSSDKEAILTRFSENSLESRRPEIMTSPAKDTPKRKFPAALKRNNDTIPVPVCPPSKRAAPTSVEKSPTKSSKKARDAAEQLGREKYAADLFAELNHTVFDDGLPKNTKLEWNTRLLTTAGRARWHRSRDGIQTTKIELATKILDCNERIRNTLSHEMCHLACWIISDNPREGHGRLFKSWAGKIMRRYPDIQVSTRHNYQIVYPYQWKCNLCSKVYGRYAKSIKPEECICGACKVGKLTPLFPQKTTRAKKIDVTRTLIPTGEDTLNGTRLTVAVNPSPLVEEDGLVDALRDLIIERRRF